MRAFAVIIALLSATLCSGQTITRAEYFFDSDPGQGNGTNVTFASGASVNQTFNVSTASLAPGFHTFNTRVHSSADVWSLFASRTFFIIPPTISIAPSTQVTQAEFFIDADPGLGNATPIAIAPGPITSFSVAIPTGALSFGFHTINVRTRDNEERWSLFAQRTFYIVPPTVNNFSTSITRAEYFFDTDPGRGSASPLPITAGNPQDNTFSIDVSSLQPGFHQLGVRYQDNRGLWSHFSNRTFWIINGDLTSPLTITKLEYFIDNNPGMDASLNGTGVAISPSATVDENLAIDLGTIPPGTHTLFVRAQDEKGFWSTVKQIDFTILDCTTPTPPATQNVSRCGGGSVTLSASGAINAQVYRWYQSDTSLDVLTTADNFSTPALEASRSYYVSIYDPGTGCESARSSVWAHINLQDKPVISPSGNISFCEGGSVVLSAPSGFSQYVWSTGETTRQIFVTASGQYNVRVGDGVCVSPSSDDVNVSVITGPAKPTVTVTGNTVICEAGSVSLAGPDGFTYRWSTGATTQSINVSATGAYSLLISTGSGCWSAPSDAVGVVVQSQPCGNTNVCTTPGPPTVVPGSRCGEGTVALSASGANDSQTYRWYDNPSDPIALAEGQNFTTPAIGATRDYYVSVFNPVGACESSRLAVRANVNLAIKPTVSPDGDIVFCDGGSIQLTAPSGFSQYIWSTGETSRQITVNAQAQYSVQVGDGICVSPASDPVNVVAHAVPDKPTVIPSGNTSICGSGTVTLNASSSPGYIWSNGATTQTITVSQTGVYFVRSISADNCQSLPSDPVAVTVQTPPCGSGISNESPIIDNTPLSTPIEGTVAVDLTSIVTDPDENLDYSSLRLLSTTTSRGASATIDGSYNLLIDYSGLPFTGVDRVTIEVCDLAGACVQQVIDIEVAGAVVVYNGVTPDGDGKNDFLLLKYVDVVESASENRVLIFNRWGDVVFEIDNYNNTDRVFTGQHKNGGNLPSGTYYYRVEFSGGLKSKTGFLTIKR
ncbi:MAG TPA: gliding motility-associated C-terminal domain-containing protein [Chryseosolibacter sp.]